MRFLQARGKPQEAAREVRALLDQMRENEAAVQRSASMCATELELANEHLMVLDPEVGEQDLIKAVAAEVARLHALSRSL